VHKSLREAARDLGVHRHWLRGFCEGRRIPLVKAGRMLALSPEAFKRVEAYVTARRAAA
jgi:hypothetical protein